MLHLKHEILDNAVEYAVLVVQRYARRRRPLVTLAQVQEVGTRLRARLCE